MKAFIAYLVVGKKDRYDPIDEETKKILHRHFKIVTNPEEAQVILVLGGDGTMVHAIKMFHTLNIPFYGINRGTKGFLLNNHDLKDDFTKQLHEATDIEFPLLQVKIKSATSTAVTTVFAFNDIWTKCFSEAGQASKMRIFINGKNITMNEHCDYLSADGIIICSPGGSTAYNLSAGGLIVDPNSNGLGLTPICAFNLAFKPQLVEDTKIIRVEIVEPDKRPTTVFADNHGTSQVSEFTVKKSPFSCRIFFRSDLSYHDKLDQIRFPWLQ